MAPSSSQPKQCLRYRADAGDGRNDTSGSTTDPTILSKFVSLFVCAMELSAVVMVAARILSSHVCVYGLYIPVRVGAFSKRPLGGEGEETYRIARRLETRAERGNLPDNKCRDPHENLWATD